LIDAKIEEMNKKDSAAARLKRLQEDDPETMREIRQALTTRLFAGARARRGAMKSPSC
jgi:hypothetical protein